jgi:hypothetical protein
MLAVDDDADAATLEQRADLLALVARQRLDALDVERAVVGQRGSLLQRGGQREGRHRPAEHRSAVRDPDACLDERTPASARALVNCTSNGLGTILHRPEQHHRTACRTGELDLEPKSAHRRALALQRRHHRREQVAAKRAGGLDLALELAVALGQLARQTSDLQVRADPRDDLVGIERLADEIDGPRREAGEAILDAVGRRQEQHRSVAQRRIGLEPAAGLVPVDARHA